MYSIISWYLIGIIVLAFEIVSFWFVDFVNHRHIVSKGLLLKRIKRDLVYVWSSWLGVIIFTVVFISAFFKVLFDMIFND